MGNLVWESCRTHAVRELAGNPCCAGCLWGTLLCRMLAGNPCCAVREPAGSQASRTAQVPRFPPRFLTGLCLHGQHLPLQGQVSAEVSAKVLRTARVPRKHPAQHGSPTTSCTARFPQYIWMANPGWRGLCRGLCQSFFRLILGSFFDLYSPLVCQEGFNHVPEPK